MTAVLDSPIIGTRPSKALADPGHGDEFTDSIVTPNGPYPAAGGRLPSAV